jgi:hypothetical protein
MDTSCYLNYCTVLRCISNIITLNNSAQKSIGEVHSQYHLCIKVCIAALTKDFDFHLAKAYFAVALILVSVLIGGTEGIPGTTPLLSYNGY